MGFGKHSLIDYTTIDLYLPKVDRRTEAITHKVHLVDGLNAKMLIGMDIFQRVSITINIGNKQATIGSCNNIVLPLGLTPQVRNQFSQQILSDQNATIPPRSIGQVLARSKLPEGWDLLFKPLYTKPNVKVFVQIIDCGMKEILMKNNTNKTLVINEKTKLGRVVEYRADGYYKTHIDQVGTASTDPQRLTIRNLLAYNSHSGPSKSILENGITIYGNPGKVNKIAQIA